MVLMLRGEVREECVEGVQAQRLLVQLAQLRARLEGQRIRAQIREAG